MIKVILILMIISFNAIYSKDKSESCEQEAENIRNLKDRISKSKKLRSLVSSASDIKKYNEQIEFFKEKALAHANSLEMDSKMNQENPGFFERRKINTLKQNIKKCREIGHEK